MMDAANRESVGAAGRAPRLREPGLAAMRPGYERYRVPACGSMVIELSAGDRLSLVDVEGGQSGEMVAFDGQGRPDIAALGASANASGDALRTVLTADSESARRVRAGLARRGLVLDGVKSLRVLGANNTGGERADFTAERRVVCMIAAPGERMRVDQHNPPGDLLAVVERARVPASNHIPLPEPLTEPRLDLRINAATAEAYEVFAGEFIQIIDVAGRECSDFQVFDRRNLDRGIERPLDLTTTRPLVGAAYPGPGLFGKYFNRDMDPVVEVVRDTVGRHDTFGLACFRKYYEDQGFFGHSNCSDNFNKALAPFGVQPRRGWEAVNFFYNTGIDAHNVLYLDEPWSRPGDYVLLKALTDLVGVSSACPDDTSAANGWAPTDIHVRVYPAHNRFSRAIAFRMKPDADARLTRETGFHPRTSALTRNFVEYRGFWLPACFRDHGAAAEYDACRNKAVAMDLSALRKFEVIGSDAESLLQWTATRNVRRLAEGQVVYTAMCYEHGGMFDDGTIFRLGADKFRWIGGDEFGGEWLREQARARGLDRVSIRSSTDQIHNIAVQGPLSRDILKQLIWTPTERPSLEELQWFRFTVGRLGDLHGIPIMVSRTGYTGELGYELFCHPDDAPVVWDAVFGAGKLHGLLPLGLDALDMIRIESGLVFAGYEFSDETDPFEAGIGFAVPLKSKEDDFLGRDALVRRKANPVRKLVGLELAGNETAAHGDCVYVGRAQVGVVTSATRSPVLRKNIALARLDVTYAEPDTAVEVGKLDGQQKRIPAAVVQFPFYDPDKVRVRA